MLEKPQHFEFFRIREAYQDTYKHHSTIVRCTATDKLAHGSYSGLMTSDACTALGSSFKHFAKGMGTIERIDGALTTDFLDPPNIDHLFGTPPGAYIVRVDQFEAMNTFARLLATLGVVRSVWLPEHFRHAHDWCVAVNG